MEKISQIVRSISDFVWGVPLIVLILFVGVLLTIGLKGIQITKLKKALKYSVTNEEDGVGEVSSFGALCISLSATIGTGSIIGVATAIALGGPGSLFWMIVASLLGMATKYAEGYLGIRYRKIRKDGTTMGGPYAYIEHGMGSKWKWLAKLFAVFGMLSGVMGMGTLTQISGITASVDHVFLTESSKIFNILGTDVSLLSMIVGAVITIASALVLLGGIDRIEKVCIVIVPFMAIAYIVICLLVIGANITNVPNALLEIIKCAFDTKAIAGGFTGTLLVVIQQGISKGIFSNESGLGSVPIASSTAKTKDPVRQGLSTMTSTFYIVIICLMTGLAIVMAGTWNIEGVEGVDIATLAFEDGLPFLPKIIPSCIIMVAITFFAFSSIVGWNVYGIRCLDYLTNNSKKAQTIYKWLWIFAVFIGPYLSISIIWDVANLFNGLMAIPNLIALIFLSKQVSKETNEYFKNGLESLHLEIN
jgi:AGCS family alanine or glycine:cation symporter